MLNTLESQLVMTSIGNPHIENMTSKAYSTMKFIIRNVQTNNQKVKETAYNTYFRPQFEYCAPVWHPCMVG